MRISLKLLVTVFGVSACLSACTSSCTEAPKEDQSLGLLNQNQNNTDFSSSSSGNFNEPEGPQYQQPGMDVLKGKPQLFPARYPAKRYPGSRVALVDVRPNRPAGYKNMVMLTTSDQTPRISSFYTEQMITENWQKVGEYRNEIYESTKWVKGNLECEVRISPDLTSQTDKKNVQLLYGIRPKSIVKVKTN